MKILAYLAIVAVMIYLVTVVYNSWKECDESGGVLVRGILSTQCVEIKNNDK